MAKKLINLMLFNKIMTFVENFLYNKTINLPKYIKIDKSDAKMQHIGYFR